MRPDVAYDNDFACVPVLRGLGYALVVAAGLLLGALAGLFAAFWFGLIQIRC